MYMYVMMSFYMHNERFTVQAFLMMYNLLLNKQIIMWISLGINKIIIHL